MSKFTKAMFSVKKAYQFEDSGFQSLEQYFLNELVFQLQDLEAQWVRLDMKNWRTELFLKQEIEYHRHLERVLFRLEEIIHFLSRCCGPRIIRYVCSEIYDLLREREMLGEPVLEEEIKQVELILVVMNSFFQPEVPKLNLMTIEELAEKLKMATEQLLSRYADEKKEL